MVTVKNKFDTLQEISERHTSNDEYKNFITHLEAAAECILTKPRAKCRIPQEKQDNMKKASLLNKRNPTNINMQKLKPREN